MKWIKEVPKVPGIYLRNNPPSSHVVRQDIYFIGKELCTSGDSSSAIRLKKWHGAKSMWWYGPIPRPPENADDN